MLIHIHVLCDWPEGCAPPFKFSGHGPGIDQSLQALIAWDAFWNQVGNRSFMSLGVCVVFMWYVSSECDQ